MNLKLIFPEETGWEYGVSSAEVVKNEKRFVGKHTYAAVFLQITSFPHYHDLSHCLAKPVFSKVWSRGPGAKI